MNETTEPRIRVDKWLWAARFFKTRSLAAEAIQGGKVHVNGQRVKPARGVRVGDALTIQRGEERFEIMVQALSDRRGPASVATTLYEETAASQRAREQRREQRRLQAAGRPQALGRPDKRARREARRLKH